MAKKRKARNAALAVTADRAPRLYRLLQLVGSAPHTRETLMRRLRLNIRGFYRDLNVLRHFGIHFVLKERRYHLKGSLEKAVARLPMPDPGLTLGEAVQLARGKTPAHKKLQRQIRRITR